MCYSAMVEQNAKKYGVRFKARVDTGSYRVLFERRLAGERALINPGMEAQFLGEGVTGEEEVIGDLIRAWHAQQVPLLEQELFVQKKRLEDAKRQLEKKVTKKAENDSRIAANKIEKLKGEIAKHGSSSAPAENESRIFPLHYMSVLCLDASGDKIVRPMRYLMRPHDKDASFDGAYNGCYNARFDALRSVAWWRSSLEQRRGIIMVKRFYENVDAERYRLHDPSAPASAKKSFVLCFQPDNTDYMIVPVLWDEWGEGMGAFASAAIITDEPAPEIAAAGHDRTPIFLSEPAVDEWLSTMGEGALEVLKRRERPHYSHRLLDAA